MASEDVHNPEEVIPAVKKAAPVRIDFLRFWQDFQKQEAKFEYYKEWRQIAAIPIKDYKQWFEKQISPKARNKIRKSSQVRCDRSGEEAQ